VRAKLAENAAQIVDLMHARDEAQRECAEAEIRARRAESTAEHCAKLAGAARAEAAKLRGDIKRWHDALTMPLGPLTRKELRQQMLDAVASTEPITAADMEWAKRALSTPPAGLP
jgi:hypothetical protein